MKPIRYTVIAAALLAGVQTGGSRLTPICHAKACDCDSASWMLEGHEPPPPAVEYGESPESCAAAEAAVSQTLHDRVPAFCPSLCAEELSFPSGCEYDPEEGVYFVAARFRYTCALCGTDGNP
jgi:hypothetical protein